MRSLHLIGATAVVLALSGCATVVRGTKANYRITSVPPMADVTLSTGEHCITPCKLKLKRKNAFTAAVTKPGYNTETVKVASKLSGGGVVAAAGNVLAGGVVGGVVDGRNGSLNGFYPGKLHVTLTPAGDGQAGMLVADAAGARPSATPPD